ncbi:hypothetical protein GALMADRAFT_830398 [Galerina marginata CBS 339.88]|uniref:Uncharacterized protein n=1 Tax=Galerina marginata (strain CBS 339.88) TaxID=685588 RepID=A0A067TUB4_GALM3|nr:hypothetical protein GALMADRAFT_830398 [Galerina marginata CBS 339.88]
MAALTLIPHCDGVIDRRTLKNGTLDCVPLPKRYNLEIYYLGRYLAVLGYMLGWYHGISLAAAGLDLPDSVSLTSAKRDRLS